MKRYFIVLKSIGDTIVETINTYNHILKNNIEDFKIYYKYDFQKSILDMVPIFKNKLEYTPLGRPGWGMRDKNLLKEAVGLTLEIPDYYKCQLPIKKDSICIHIRTPTWNFGGHGLGWEPHRNVNPNPYLKLIKKLSKDYQITIIGDPGSPNCEGKNIYQLARDPNKVLLDDFYAVSVGKLLITADTGVSYFGPVFGTPVLISNLTKPSGYYTRKGDWYGKHKLLYKKLKRQDGSILTDDEVLLEFGLDGFSKNARNYEVIENTYEELLEGVRNLL